MAEEQKAHAAGRQFVSEMLRELGAVESDVLRGRNRFPAQHELTHGPAQFRSILAIAERIVGQWEQLPPEVASGIEQALMQLLELVALIESRGLRTETDMPSDSRRVSGEIKQKLGRIQEFFNETVEPLLPTAADVVSAASELSEQEAENVKRTRQQLDEAERKIAELQARAARVNAELESREDLLEAAREESGASGTQNLAEEYDEQAEDHEQQWKYWGAGLIGATLIALVGGYFVLKINHPATDATTSQLVSHAAVDLLVIGILIYVVRVTSLQFSVHRHLAAVARNKAAALATFSRIVNSGSSSETRDRLAEVLAHYVFVSSDTGFLDSAGDQITLPERLAGPVAQRINGARSGTSSPVS